LLTGLFPLALTALDSSRITACSFLSSTTVSLKVRKFQNQFLQFFQKNNENVSLIFVLASKKLSNKIKGTLSFQLKGDEIKEFQILSKIQSSQNCSSFKSEFQLNSKNADWPSTDKIIVRVLDFQFGPDWSDEQFLYFTV
jgi:ribosomal protein S17E